MGTPNYKQIYAIKERHKKELLALNPDLKNVSGIYFFTRTDENGFKFAYIGQAIRVTDRLVSHLEGYSQHIDLSLKRHKLYDAEKNPYGWKVGMIEVPKEEFDETERKYIKMYADNGYQLRNVSLGGQNKGRNMINETKPARGYREGVLQGKRTLARELKHIIDTHLVITLKKPSKTSEKALLKFNDLLDENNYKSEREGK